MKSSPVVRSERVASYGAAQLYRDVTANGRWSYRLMRGDHLIANDYQRHWLQEIMYQVGANFPNGFDRTKIPS